jgi:excisionase family DNA binding protein
MENPIIDKEFSDKVYLTQAELAKRFRVSPSTIKNWRDQGKLEYFQPDGSSRVLYPRESVEAFERRFTRRAKGTERRKQAEVKREVHGMSSKPQKEWRI